ncbi:MAG: hypothetical protein K6G04_01970 [Lachnospiraceae bacterium]|nr:hypothetical protein [Lachnospiraceae bacterium]
MLVQQKQVAIGLARHAMDGVANISPKHGCGSYVVPISDATCFVVVLRQAATECKGGVADHGRKGENEYGSAVENTCCVEV